MNGQTPLWEIDETMPSEEREHLEWLNAMKTVEAMSLDQRLRFFCLKEPKDLYDKLHNV